jgi:hypothetical protein
LKDYPSIDLAPRYGTQVYFCDKLDGSNIRAEWDRKKGLWKFGRRKGLLDDSNPFLPQSEQMIQDTFGDALGRIFTKQRWRKATAFFEFWGPQSFAGNHEEGDDFRVTLIDVAADKKGILEPKQFYKLFGDLPVAELLDHGKFNKLIEREIQAGEWSVTFEGVVCKGARISPGRPLMFKVKTRAWLDKLKAHCKGDDALFERLR